MKVRFKHRAEYAALRTVMFCAGLLPEGIAYRCAAGLGRLFFRCSKRRQKIALRMLRNAYPERKDADLLRLGRVATGNMFKVGLDMLRLGKCLESDTFRRRLDTEEFERTIPAPPFLGVTAHLGSWEVGGAGMSMCVGGADVVVQTFKNPLVQGFLERSRARANLRLHPRRGGIRGLARALEAGRVGLQAVDQNQRLRGIFVPFFGEIASTERAAATLALRKGYPVCVGCAVRTGVGFRFRLFTFPPIRPVSTGDREADIESLVREINARLEELVLRHPEQYLWIHDRYKTRPPTESAD